MHLYVLYRPPTSTRNAYKWECTSGGRELPTYKNSSWIFNVVLDHSKLIFQFFPLISWIKIFSNFLDSCSQTCFFLQDLFLFVYFYFNSKRWVWKWKALLLCRFWRVFFSARDGSVRRATDFELAAPSASFCHFLLSEAVLCSQSIRFFPFANSMHFSLFPSGLFFIL